MPAVPTLTAPPEPVRDHIRQWYQEHKLTYTKVWDNLASVRQQWAAAGYEGKVALLKLSYLNSVLSIRTPLHIHEESFERIMRGEGVLQAMENAGAGLAGSRTGYVRETLADDALWDRVVDALRSGQVDRAHKILLDNALFIGTAKAPFTLANLGFTEKMCINGNLSTLLKAENQPETQSIEAYEGLCAEIQEMFPDLADMLDPYQLQWLLFDYQRFFRANQEGGLTETGRRGMAIAQHNIWFETALGDIEAIKSRMRALTRWAKNAPSAPPESAQVEAEIESAIEAAVAATGVSAGD